MIASRSLPPPFVPRPYLRQGHVMTVFAWARPRAFPELPARDARLVRVSDDTQVLAHCYWQSSRAGRPTLLALHGLEGSSDAHYMRGLAAKAYARGMNVVRLNQRNCGGTEHLSAGLFHSGLTADAAHVIDELIQVDRLPAIGVAGYSLGGNVTLKLAAEYGGHAPAALRAVAAVSPIIEIGDCVRALERPGNALYQWNFVKDLKRRIRRKERVHPGLFDLKRLSAVRTVREFDEVYTARYFGFRGADDYYHRASALRIIDRVRVPTLIITAADDPFVPVEPFHDPKIAGNPNIELHVCRHGGHCGFVGPKSGEDDGYWAENQIVDFVERHPSPA